MDVGTAMLANLFSSGLRKDLIRPVWVAQRERDDAACHVVALIPALMKSWRRATFNNITVESWARMSSNQTPLDVDDAMPGWVVHRKAIIALEIS